MRSETTAAVAARLAAFDPVVEIGVGARPAVAATLARSGVTVTATDVRERSVPDGVRFVRDDVTDPDPQVYAGAEALYARNLPPELHRPAWTLARSIGAAFRFTTLGSEQPAIPVERETLPGTVLFAAKTQPA